MRPGRPELSVLALTANCNQSFLLQEALVGNLKKVDLSEIQLELIPTPKRDPKTGKMEDDG